MKKLSIDEALLLYDILAKYFPEDCVDDPDFIGKIVHNIKSGNQPGDYIQALSILTDYTPEDIVTVIDPATSVEMFYDGLIGNRVLSLKKFCDELNYGRGR